MEVTSGYASSNAQPLTNDALPDAVSEISDNKADVLRLSQICRIYNAVYFVTFISFIQSNFKLNEEFAQLIRLGVIKKSCNEVVYGISLKLGKFYIVFS